ncbi:MAG: hypothetical protein ACTH2Q_02750 [Propionibacteriaceae bacterium]
MTSPATSARPLPDRPAVLAALKEPWRLVEAARTGGQAWSEPYGGPEGVAVLATEIRDQLERQVRAVAELRAVAVAELLRDRSLSDVGSVLGIGKTAVHKINREVATRPHAYGHLLLGGQW